jgi:hypothetical protein
MYEISVWATGAVLLMAGLFAYRRYGDPVHPLILVGPFFFYGYFYIPMVFQSLGGMERYLEPSQLTFVGIVYLGGVLAFCVGCLMVPRPAGRGWGDFLSRIEGHPLLQQRFRLAAWILWLGATAVNIYVIEMGGGFRRVFARTKAYVSLSSGYIADLPAIAHVAVFLYALSLRNKRVGLRHLSVFVVMEAFGFLGGTIGGRRGLLFVSFLTVCMGWFIARGARLKLHHALLAALLAGLGVLFVQSQRQTFLRVGSGYSFQQDSFVETIFPQSVNPNVFYMVGGARMVSARETGHYGWGESFARNLLARPIPHQLWPGQYESIEELWKSLRGYSMHSADGSRHAAWQPSGGTSTGGIAAAFTEFSWGAFFVFFLLGQMYGRFWRNFRSRGGVWTLLYAASVAVSPYLPTQSLAGAYLYRLLLLCVPSYVVWQLFIQPYWLRASSQLNGAAEKRTEEAQSNEGRAQEPETSPGARRPSGELEGMTHE